ncbi:hypothetical protein CDAR_424711 [Caerostris darwini]|uniref:Uncharacterized protein n=1 Tax=Caerostris darwini TaxID=1538125 RepID=A0AAV4RTT8_9ARAC|nr:hypothetical protein CDAR_424711 [Caerostris darwini]
MQKNMAIVKTNHSQSNQNSDLENQPQKSTTVENNSKIDASQPEKNKKKRRKVLRVRNRNKNNNTTKIKETKAVLDNQTKENNNTYVPAILPAISEEIIPASNENTQGKNITPLTSGEVMSKNILKESANNFSNSSLNENEKSLEDDYYKEERSAELISSQPWNQTNHNSNKQSKQDFWNTGENISKNIRNDHEYSGRKSNLEHYPNRGKENSAKNDNDYLLTFNYRGDKKDQSKNIRLSNVAPKREFTKRLR